MSEQNKDKSIIDAEKAITERILKRTNHKLSTEHKKVILVLAQQGYTNMDIAEVLHSEFGLKISYEAVRLHRKKWQKQINRKIKDELAEAKASEPLAQLANRLGRYDEIYDLARGEELKAAEEMYELDKKAEEGEIRKDQGYYNRRTMLKAKRERALSAMNDAIKNAGTDTINKEKLVTRERDMALKMGDLESQKQILEETIEHVAGKITHTRRVINEQTRISGMVGWDDEDEESE